MKSTEFVGDLILLRGLPGSGKTTLASIILQSPNFHNLDVLSADNFFTDDDGK
jgi:uridine kinase